MSLCHISNERIVVRVCTFFLFLTFASFVAIRLFAKKTVVPARGLSQHLVPVFQPDYSQKLWGMETQVLFLGDSIINRMQEVNIWSEWFEPFHAENLGVDGLTTEGLLALIDRTNFEIYAKLKVIVVSIGTNNVFKKAEDVADDIIEIVRLLVQRSPGTRIVVVEIFPKGQGPNTYREKDAATNFLLEQRLTSKTVQVVNLDPGFVAADGSINRDDLRDFLHFTEDAYKRAFAPLRDMISKIVTEQL